MSGVNWFELILWDVVSDKYIDAFPIHASIQKICGGNYAVSFAEIICVPNCSNEALKTYQMNVFLCDIMSITDVFCNILAFKVSRYFIGPQVVVGVLP